MSASAALITYLYLKQLNNPKDFFGNTSYCGIAMVYFAIFVLKGLVLWRSWDHKITFEILENTFSEVDWFFCVVLILFLINSYWSIIASQCCVSFSCAANWISYPCTYSPSFPSHWGHPRAMSGVPCAVQEVPISYMCFLHSINNVYMSSPISQLIPSLLSFLVSIHLFCTSVSPFLLCK